MVLCKAEAAPRRLPMVYVIIILALAVEAGGHLAGGGCGGGYPGICRRPEAICQSLVEFHRSMTSSSRWVEEDGWSTARNVTCSTYMSPYLQMNDTATPPPYCSWPGVVCCSNVSKPNITTDCAYDHAVRSLDLKSNNLTGSLQDPRLLSSLHTLLHSGLRGLRLHANKITGDLSPGLVRNFVNLRCVKRIFTVAYCIHGHAACWPALLFILHASFIGS